VSCLLIWDLGLVLSFGPLLSHPLAAQHSP
jgi:hypothetical protein